MFIYVKLPELRRSHRGRFEVTQAPRAGLLLSQAMALGASRQVQVGRVSAKDVPKRLRPMAVVVNPVWALAPDCDGGWRSQEEEQRKR